MSITTAVRVAVRVAVVLRRRPLWATMPPLLRNLHLSIGGPDGSSPTIAMVKGRYDYWHYVCDGALPVYLRIDGCSFVIYAETESSTSDPPVLMGSPSRRRYPPSHKPRIPNPARTHAVYDRGWGWAYRPMLSTTAVGGGRIAPRRP